MENVILKKRMNDFYDKFAPLGAIRNAPMSAHTSFKIGGAADILFAPHDEEELVSALNCLKEYDLPFFVMGNGTNLLVHDSGIRSVVIKLRTGEPRISFNIDDCIMTASASTLLSVAVKRSVDVGLMGLEWGAGIPGTLGGAIAMNAGAYGGELKDCVISVDTIEYENGVYVRKQHNTSEADFGYRYSRYAYPSHIVLSASFKLKPDDGGAKERMESYTRLRTSKQPLAYPSAGSVFKRPEGHYAGTLIEEAGLKGASIGGAQVSELHAGFIVNTGGATAQDVCSLIDYIKKTVYNNSGVMLEEELRITGG